MQKEIDKQNDWEKHWQTHKNIIAKALDYQDFYTLDDVYSKIRLGNAFLWPGKESAIITEFVVFPRKKLLHILVIAGKYKEIEKMFICIEDYAKKLNIDRITGSGRKGWFRKTKHLGFKQEYLISKDL